MRAARIHTTPSHLRIVFPGCDGVRMQSLNKKWDRAVWNEFFVQRKTTFESTMQYCVCVLHGSLDKLVRRCFFTHLSAVSIVYETR